MNYHLIFKCFLQPEVFFFVPIIFSLFFATGFLISVILSFAYLTLSQPLLESSNPPLLKTKKEINEVLSE